ncbi:hypothetical protein CANARDRAFT_10133 [[Candida] arabinofermentans NRRL YB-2248]|uniref:Mitochondrial phosphate carrier protein n=1 Tax=[Candida] arabinofermentans NRRL YB-2248 TaxID=983967 RepID=A0A1E4STU2_9ASCO|nr:hypothetical protein CANARDRAFT_10133 [[Candida] arabinofermentans NRRL YB-2248]
MSKIELNSPAYFTSCAIGGFLACAPTHSGILPLDLVKCRLQVQPGLYSGLFPGIKTIIKNEGLFKIFAGFKPTFIGYGLQGSGKYGFYELFKFKYSEFFGYSNTFIYILASASAEFLADLMLCPFESMKVKIQTTIPPNQISNLYSGLYSGLVPLWFRQIPYTCVKFTSFEKIVELIYSNFLTKPKTDYSKLQQTGVSFLGGYIAGIFCAVCSHPADVMVSLINNQSNKQKGSMIDNVKTIYSKIGFKGLWNGLPVRIVMIGTLTGFQWLIYDSFKVSIGLPTTGA